ncbi:MAG: hypothetical protein KGQ61_04905 [Planctomycetes bacterium]|nr:hypothetical protein [Planctomycetota bacterium]
MAISVMCPGCKTVFSVSDKFAGKTGPCPKCKQQITVPAASKGIVIHEPEAPSTTSTASGRAPTAPLVRFDLPMTTTQWAVWGMLLPLGLFLALAARFLFGAGQAPGWCLAAAALLFAIPCARLGYEAIRDRELEPYRGLPLTLRTLACGVAWALLWFAHGFIPPDMTRELWQWLFIGPIFFGVGALAALAAFDFDWGTAVAHFSLYAIVTALARWLAGFPPV